jgi:hypothetical protein
MNFHGTEKVLVAKLGATLPSDVTAGSSAPSTTRLFSLTTDQYNLTAGTVTAMRPVPNSGNPEVVPTAGTAVSKTNTPKIKVYQKRDVSGDRSPLPNRPVEESQWINPMNCPSITFTGTAGAVGQNNAWVIGGASTSAINVTSETFYEIRGAADGLRVDKFWSNRNTPFDYAKFTTPDFTVAPYSSYTSAQQLDFLCKNLVADYNKKSMVNLSIAIGLSMLDAGATTGSTTLAAAAALTSGDVIIIGYDVDGGVISLKVTSDMVRTFGLLEAAFVAAGSTAGDVTIIPYAKLSNTNTTDRPTLLPGAGAVSRIAILALEYKEAYFADNVHNKVRLTVGLSNGFTASVANTNVVAPKEPVNSGRQVRMKYQYEQDFAKYPVAKRWEAMSILYPNGILEDALYDVYTIEHCSNGNDNSGATAMIPYQTTICLVRTDDASGTTPYSTGSANPQKTHLETQINAFMSVWGYNSVTL